MTQTFFNEGDGFKFATDVNMTSVGGRIRVQRDSANNETYTDLELIRNSTGAPAGPVGTDAHNTSLLRIVDTCGTSNIAHWPLCVEMRVGGGGSTEHTGAYIQGIKTAPGSGVFGTVVEVRDDSGQSSNIAGPLVSMELDNTANGADADNLRIVLDCVIARSEVIGPPWGNNQIGSVFRIGARPGEGSIKRVLRSMNDTPVSESVIDTTNFVLGPNAATLAQSAGQRIALDAQKDGSFSRTIGFMAGKGLTYTMGNADLFSVSDQGDLVFARTLVGRQWPVGAGAPPAGLPSGAVWVDLAAGNVLKAV